MTINLPKIYNQFNQRIENLFDSKYGVWKLTVILFICFSLLYFPEIINKRLGNSWTGHDRAIQAFVNDKISHPFKPFLSLESWNHFRKRDLRITPYLIGNVFHLEAIKLFYIQALIFFPLFIFLSLKTIRQLSQDSLIAFWGTIALLFTYVGNSFHYDTLFYDSYAYLGLMAAFYFRSHWIMFPILLASYFVDERSVIPSTLLFIVEYISKSNLASPDSLKTQFIKSTWQNKSFLKVAFVIAIYCLIRVWLYFQYQLQTPVGEDSGIHLFVVLKHKIKVPMAIFSALKLDILFVYLTASQLFKWKQSLVAIAYVMIFSLIFIISTAVEDVTRSLAFGFPLLMIYFQLLSKERESQNNQRLFVAMIALVNMLLPTYTLLLHLYQVDAFGWIQLF